MQNFSHLTLKLSKEFKIQFYSLQSFYFGLFISKIVKITIFRCYKNSGRSILNDVGCKNAKIKIFIFNSVKIFFVFTYAY